MSQKTKLESRVREILENSSVGSNGAPNFLVGGCDGKPCAKCNGSGVVGGMVRKFKGAGEVGGMVRKFKGAGEVGGMVRKPMSANLNEGKKRYQNFMREAKLEGNSHKEANLLWKQAKSSGAGYWNTFSKAFGGAASMPDPHNIAFEDEDQNNPALRDQIQNTLLEDLKEEPQPGWNGLELAETMGSGAVGGAKKSSKKPRKKRAPQSAESLAKLKEGRERYQVFMKHMKDAGLTHKEALGIYRDLKAKHGSGWWGDFAKGFEKGFLGVMKPAMSLLPLIL